MTQTASAGVADHFSPAQSKPDAFRQNTAEHEQDLKQTADSSPSPTPANTSKEASVKTPSGNLARYMAFKVSLAALILAFAFSTFNAYNNNLRIKRSLHQTTDTIINSTLPALQLASNSNNTALAKQLTDSLIQHSAINSALLVQNNGSPLASSRRISQCDPSIAQFFLRDTPKALIKPLPLANNSNHNPGRLYLELDHCPLLQELNRMALTTLGYSLLISLITAGFIYALFYRHVTGPLTRLSRHIDQIKPRNITQRDIDQLNLPLDNELGQLGKRYQLLLSTLKSYINRQHNAEQTINAYSTKLEQLIQRRNKALSLMNRQIQRSHSDQVAEPERSLKGLKVLLVDDNRVNSMLCQRFLHNLEVRCECADNGLQALELCQQERFDMILMDCQMPIMDGYTATRQIRNNSMNEETPIIALTGLTGDNERQTCLSSGMNDYISKPFTQDQIHAAIKQWLHDDSSQQDEPQTATLLDCSQL